MKEQIIKLLLARLDRSSAEISEDFQSPSPVKTKFTAIDDLLPDELARQIFSAFPPFDQMRLLDSFREKKYTSKSLDQYNPLIADITFAFQDQRVIDKVAELTSIKEPHGDPKLYAGGISAMAKGHFLNPHLDNSHDLDQKHYRVLNLLYYCSPGWKPEFGGNLELWNEDVTEALEIPSLFNRLVLMATNDKSWHSVNEVRTEGSRCCISNYYFSPVSPNGYETTHVTYFKARPEQKLRRILTKADSDIRTMLRKVKKSGFSKKDIYEGKLPE